MNGTYKDENNIKEDNSKICDERLNNQNKCNLCDYSDISNNN